MSMAPGTYIAYDVTLFTVEWFVIVLLEKQIWQKSKKVPTRRGVVCSVSERPDVESKLGHRKSSDYARPAFLSR